MSNEIDSRPEQMKLNLFPDDSADEETQPTLASNEPDEYGMLEGDRAFGEEDTEEYVPALEKPVQKTDSLADIKAKIQNQYRRGFAPESHYSDK
jgi:hypothetical protein